MQSIASSHNQVLSSKELIITPTTTSSASAPSSKCTQQQYPYHNSFSQTNRTIPFSHTVIRRVLDDLLNLSLLSLITMTTTLSSSSSSSSSPSSSSPSLFFIDCVMNHRWEEALELLQEQPTCLIEQRPWDDRNALHLVAAMACSFVNSTNNIYGGRRGGRGRNVVTEATIVAAAEEEEEEVDQSIMMLLQCLEQWQQHITAGNSSSDLWWTAMAHRDTRGLTPLLVACAHRAPLPIIEFLLRRPIVSFGAATATATAAAGDNKAGQNNSISNTETMKAMISMTDRDGWTPLHYLVACPYSTWEIEDEVHQRLRQRLHRQGQIQQQLQAHHGTADADESDNERDSSSSSSAIRYTLARVVKHIVEICPHAGLSPNNAGQTPLEFLALTFQTELERHCHSSVSQRNIKRRRIVHSVSSSSSSFEEEHSVIGDVDGDTAIDFMTINNRIAHDVWDLVRMFVHAPTVSAPPPETSRSIKSIRDLPHKKSKTMGEEFSAVDNDNNNNNNNGECDILLYRLASIRPTCPKNLFVLAVQLFPDQLLVCNGSGSHGNTPLHQAITMKNTQLISCMVETNPGCCAVVNSKNQTPLCLAIELSSKCKGKAGDGDEKVGGWRRDVHGVLIEAYPTAVHKNNIPPALYDHLLEHWTKTTRLGTEQTFLNIQSWLSTTIPYRQNDGGNNSRRSSLTLKLRKNNNPRTQLIFELLRSGADQLLT